MRNREVARMRYSLKTVSCSEKRSRNARMSREKGDNVKDSSGRLHTDSKDERSKEKEII